MGKSDLKSKMVVIPDYSKTLFFALAHPKKALIKFGGLLFEARNYSALKKTFIYQQYLWDYTHIRPNTTFVDVGTYIGDTAIYFAMNDNVRTVLAYEAIPVYYNKALENVKISPFKRKIKLHNMAVLSQSGNVYLKNNHNGYDFGLNNRKWGSSVITIRAVSLASVIKGLRNVALKCYVDNSESSMLNGLGFDNVYLVDVIIVRGSVGTVRNYLRSNGFETHEFASREDGRLHVRGIKQ